MRILPPQNFLGLDLDRQVVPEPRNQIILHDMIVEVLRSVIPERVIFKVMQSNLTERKRFARIRLVDQHVETSAFNLSLGAGLR
jgi:hypothetical protein